jgi:hypothetical protein
VDQVTDDGVTVTWQCTPPGFCALMMGAPMSACQNCFDPAEGRVKCRICHNANSQSAADCPLKASLGGDVCSNKVCPWEAE